MHIAILNGNPDAQNTSFEQYLCSFSEGLRQKGYSISMLSLRDMDIRRCTGCWSCWVKTPGRCAVQDDSAVVRRVYINASLVVFASPVVMGFTSALMKRSQDKLLPLLLPYVELAEGECHHVGRYAGYPALGLLLDASGADREDIGLITDIYRRIALNFKARLAFSLTMETPPEEAANEIDSL